MAACHQHLYRVDLARGGAQFLSMSPQPDVRKELHRGDTELASGTGPLWFSNGASWGPGKTLSSQTCIILAPTEQWGEILTMTNSGSVLRIMATGTHRTQERRQVHRWEQNRSTKEITARKLFKGKLTQEDPQTPNIEHSYASQTTESQRKGSK